MSSASSYKVRDLVASLRKRPRSATPLERIVELLVVLRDHASEYRAESHDRPHQSLLDGLVETLVPAIREALGSAPDFFVSKPGVDAVESLVGTDQFQSLTPLMLARVVARAMEKGYEPDLDLMFRSYYEIDHAVGPTESRPLRPDDPVPICNTIFGRAGGDVSQGAAGPSDVRRRGEYGTNPRNLPRWRDPDRLGRVLLAPPSVAKFQVVLEFGLSAELESLQRDATRIATVHPMSTIDDVDVAPEGDHYFAEVAPAVGKGRPFRTRSQYRSFLKKAIVIAHREAAHIVVVPELAVTPDDQLALHEFWSKGMKSEADVAPLILVGGSAHIREDGLRNRATIEGAASRVHVDKTVPYVRNVDGVLRVESIRQHREPRVTVLCSSTLTALVLICADFLLDDYRDLARDLLIGLLVVPSMTDKSMVFKGLVDGHIAATQSSVVFANSIASDDDASRGYVGHPKRDHSVYITPQWSDAVADGPGVAIIDLEDSEASRWIGEADVRAERLRW